MGTELSYRLILQPTMWRRLNELMRAAEGFEQGCFILFRSARGETTVRLLAHELIAPQPDAWDREGRDWLTPTARWVSAVFGAAIEEQSGVAFVHSHPFATRANLSSIDLETSARLARALAAGTGQPFLSLVWVDRGLEGEVFAATPPYRTGQRLAVEVIGSNQFFPLSGDAAGSVATDLDSRQRLAFGATNERLRSFKVGVVGLGGTGSPLAEELARAGIGELLLVDPDVVDEASNLRRIIGSTQGDLAHSASKVSIAERNVRTSSPRTRVRALKRDVREQSVARQLIDMDLVLSTTDTHSSRAAVDRIATQFWVPLIDVGVRIGTRTSRRISGMPIDVRTVLPDTACLWCRGVLDSNRIAAENLPSEERLRLEREGYVQGVADPQPSFVALNFAAASAAFLTALRLVVGETSASLSFLVDLWEIYAQEQPNEIDANCVCQSWRGKGDTMRIPSID